MDENKLVSEFVVYFSQWFEITREVYDDSKKNRIDLICTDKANSGRFWFGVECKIPDRKRGVAIYEIIKQCERYALSNFGGNKIPVFLCPALSINQLAGIQEHKIINNQRWTRDVHQPSHEHHTANGMLCGWNIGEVRRINPDHEEVYYIFSFCNKTIFSTRWGFHEKNYRKLLEKINR